MKLNAFDSAMASVRQVKCHLGYSILEPIFQVLKIQPNNEKALFRKAKILQEKSHVEEAIGGSTYSSLEPDQTTLNFIMAGFERSCSRNLEED